MPKARFANLTSWSYSVYTQYVKCPLSICFEKIQRVRIQEPDNPAFVKGNRVHGAAEAYVGGIGRAPKITAEMEPVKDQLNRLRKARARTEQEWAFDKEWNPVDWRDWQKAWLRIKTDVCADTVKPPTVEVIDWKTGRVHDDHKQQRSLYALGGLQLVQIGQLAGGSKDTQMTVQHVYVDTGQAATEKFAMASLPALKREWLSRIKQMMTDTTFKPKTGYHCRYCKFRKSAGGPCPENM